MHIKEKGCILQLYVYQVFGIGICTTVNNAEIYQLIPYVLVVVYLLRLFPTRITFPKQSESSLFIGKRQ